MSTDNVTPFRGSTPAAPGGHDGGIAAMSTDNITPLHGGAPDTTVTFNNNVDLVPMDPETTMHSLHTLLRAANYLLANAGGGREIQTAHGLVMIGEHLADRLTDRL
jgi:hypothetical protein